LERIMVPTKQARLTRELSTEISNTMAALWTRYSGAGPSSTHTEIREDEVTISMAGVVANFERRTAPNGGSETAPLTLASYKREAQATVGRLTHRRVLSITTGHDRKSDVAIDVFELEKAGPEVVDPADARRARLRRAPRGAR
jgi:uncharacterized protein YbcI